MAKDILPAKKVSRREMIRINQHLLDDNKKFYTFAKKAQQDLEKIHKLACERYEAMPDSLLLPNTKKAKTALGEIAEIAGPYAVEVEQEDVKKAAADPPPAEVIKFKKGETDDTGSKEDRGPVPTG